MGRGLGGICTTSDWISHMAINKSCRLPALCSEDIVKKACSLRMITQCNDFRCKLQFLIIQLTLWGPPYLLHNKGKPGWPSQRRSTIRFLEFRHDISYMKIKIACKNNKTFLGTGKGDLSSIIDLEPDRMETIQRQPATRELTIRPPDLPTRDGQEPQDVKPLTKTPSVVVSYATIYEPR